MASTHTCQQDPRINSHSKPNCIFGCIQAAKAGAFAGLTPVFDIDGRRIGDGRRGPMVDRLQALYRELIGNECARGRA